MNNRLKPWQIHSDEEMCAEFRKRCEGMPDVRIVESRFEDLAEWKQAEWKQAP